MSLISQTQARITENLEETRRRTQESLAKIIDPDRAFKGLQTPDFSDNKKRGATVLSGEADSVLYLGQDARYGTTLTPSGSGGDFANKIILAVGFLNEGKKDADQIDLSNPDIRYGAGLTIYQRTDTGKDAIFDKSNPKNKDRKATTRTPQKAVSVFEINADVVEVKSRNGGVNIIAGYDPTLPAYGGSTFERPNTEYVGVNLIFGNPDESILKDEKSVYGLQPIPKGYNLVKRLDEMAQRISEVNNNIFELITNQKILELSLALHTHPTVGVGAGIALPSIDLAISIATVKTPKDIFNILNMITAKWNQVAQKVNMSSVSEGGINSLFNFTN